MTYFKQTCDKPYDRHKYRLVFKNKKSIIFEDYELMRASWFQWCGGGSLSHVDVLDVSKSKGFQ
tara:strand:- start:61 stop:252 length:192 start_codon:yes stop_codon:yes gene_type:complete